MSTNKPPRGDALWHWYFVTVLYLGFGALVLYDRWGEVGSLFEPPGTTPGRLPLNSIGDILAGFFAPLAFLWLFVATQLQRKELRLQREELAETRTVLAEQKLELEKSAKESNHQTAIMHENNQFAVSKERYESFNLKLYFTARTIYKHRAVSISVTTRSNSSAEEDWRPFKMGFLDFKPEIYLSATDPSTVDLFFENVLKSLGDIENTALQTLNYQILIDRHTQEFGSVLAEINALLSFVLNNKQFTNNSLISLRSEGLQLEQLNRKCHALRRHITTAIS